MNYDASVIILTYKQTNLLLLQLLSLAVQQTQYSFEIIITEDGSNGFQDQRIQDLIKKSPYPHTVRYVWQEDFRHRAAAARKNGIKLARGKILIFLDGDMIPDLDFIQNHLDHHQQKSDLMVAGNRIRQEYHEIEHLVKKEIPIQHILELLSQIQPREFFANIQKQEEERRRKFLISEFPWRICFSCNLSIPNSTKVYFDEEFIGWGPEDWELAHRLHQQYNYKPIYAPDIIAYEIETGEKVGNIFRGGSAQEIALFLKNELRLLSLCSEVPVSEILWSITSLRLKDNEWVIEINPNPASEEELLQQVEFVKKWLENNSI